MTSGNATELGQEQAYFDRAQEHRERKRRGLDDVPSAAANPGAARRLLAWVKGRRDHARGPDEAVAFGRIDVDDNDPLYIGNEVITDDERGILVINWKAPAAEPYYLATYQDPLGVSRRRTFRCDGNTILDFEDAIFAQIAREIAALEAPTAPLAVPAAAEPAPVPSTVEPVGAGRPGEAEVADRLLLSELDSARTGEMRQIVATIQAAQYDLIRAPLDQVLVIEGGPGTGKTAVALHRVSWLLFNHRDRLTAADVLVVGPHPAFTRYTRTVLPELGDVDVAQRDIDQLAPSVRRGRTEPIELRRLKGEARMAGLLARALDGRIGTPEPAERLLVGGRFVTLPGTEVAEVVRECRTADAPYAERRRMLRTGLTELAQQRGAPSGKETLDPVDNLVERLWPQFSAPAFVRSLFGSRRRLAAAAGGEFTPAEIELLHRRGADRLSEEVWSGADLPVLDEAAHLIAGVPEQYGHIVVDEAQDLSPMQLRCLARRSATGSMTVVGDLAQSTGAWARDHWDEVIAHLPDAQPSSVVTLRYGYRVPRRVYDLAAVLLPVAAPHEEPLRVVRDGPADPGIHRVEVGERAGRAVQLATAHAAAGRFVGLVCPPACRTELEAALAANQVDWSSADRGELDTAINLVSPQEAKGLEFDAVIVIEPEEIVASDARGHRMLFVALTRTTRYLDVVSVGDPLPLGRPEPPELPRRRSTGPPAAADRYWPADEVAPAQFVGAGQLATMERLAPAGLGEPGVGAAPPNGATGPDRHGFDLTQLNRLAEQVAASVVGGSPAGLWDEVLQRAAVLLDRHTDRERPRGRHRRD